MSTVFVCPKCECTSIDDNRRITNWLNACDIPFLQQTLVRISNSEHNKQKTEILYREIEHGHKLTKIKQYALFYSDGYYQHDVSGKISGFVHFPR